MDYPPTSIDMEYSGFYSVLNINVGMTLTTCRIHISQWYVLCGVVDGY